MLDVRQRTLFTCACERHLTDSRLSRQVGEQSIHHQWLAPRKIWNDEKLDALPTGTEPRTRIIDRLKWEAQKDEELNGPPWEYEKRLSTVSSTSESFERQHWGSFSEMGCSACEFSRACRYHLKLNWAELLAAELARGSWQHKLFMLCYGREADPARVLLLVEEVPQRLKLFFVLFFLCDWWKKKKKKIHFEIMIFCCSKLCRVDIELKRRKIDFRS